MKERGPQGNGQQHLSLIRLAPDSGIGLINAGIVARLIEEVPGSDGVVAQPAHVQLWIALALGEPLALGGVHIENVPYRMIGMISVGELTTAFNAMKEAKQATQPSLIAT